MYSKGDWFVTFIKGFDKLLSILGFSLFPLLFFLYSLFKFLGFSLYRLSFPLFTIHVNLVMLFQVYWTLLKSWKKGGKLLIYAWFTQFYGSNCLLIRMTMLHGFLSLLNFYSIKPFSWNFFHEVFWNVYLSVSSWSMLAEILLSKVCIQLLLDTPVWKSSCLICKYSKKNILFISFKLIYMY